MATAACHLAPCGPATAAAAVATPAVSSCRTAAASRRPSSPPAPSTRRLTPMLMPFSRSSSSTTRSALSLLPHSTFLSSSSSASSSSPSSTSSVSSSCHFLPQPLSFSVAKSALSRGFEACPTLSSDWISSHRIKRQRGRHPHVQRRNLIASAGSSSGGGDSTEALPSSSSSRGDEERTAASREGQAEGEGDGVGVAGSEDAGKAKVREFETVVKLVQTLKRKLDDAVAKEEYTEAARLRDEIAAAERRNPVKALEAALEDAVRDERYEDAARLQEELKALAVAISRLAPSMSASSPKPSFEPRSPPSPASCRSDTVTEGVRVVVRSMYVRARSSPSRAQYLFAYRVTVSNESGAVVQLLNRHWQISSGTGRVEHVRGPGVIGQQPVLPPGASFEYTSVCPLTTPYGAMEGEFEMVRIESDSISPPFLANIGEFSLSVDVEEF